MFDFSEMFAMQTIIEAHGKKWLKIKSAALHADGEYVLVVELNTPTPAPVYTIFVPKKVEKNDKD